ncbi:MAG: AhpC/TSA family protein [Actinomycetota bacterium]
MNRIEALGAQAIAVGTGADYQAKALMDGGLRVRCFIDAESRTYGALGIRRSSWLGLLKPSGVRRYLAPIRRGARQGRLTGDIRQLSGVAILDGQARAVWVHRGETLGDYPPVADVVDRLERST